MVLRSEKIELLLSEAGQARESEEALRWKELLIHREDMALRRKEAKAFNNALLCLLGQLIHLEYVGGYILGMFTVCFSIVCLLQFSSLHWMKFLATLTCAKCVEFEPQHTCQSSLTPVDTFEPWQPLVIPLPLAPADNSWLFRCLPTTSESCQGLPTPADLCRPLKHVWSMFSGWLQHHFCCVKRGLEFDQCSNKLKCLTSCLSCGKN